MLKVNPAIREDIAGRLAKQEKERAAIDTHPAGIPQVQELDILVVVDLEFQPLGDIVDLGGHDGIGPLEIKGGKRVQQGDPFGKILRSAGVLAIDPNHSLY